MYTPILDQIETSMDNGIILLVAIVMAITIIALIFKVIINAIISKRVRVELENKRATERAVVYRKEVVNNFFENSISYDIEQMSYELPHKAKELISACHD
jgi:hypothetical protein